MMNYIKSHKMRAGGGLILAIFVIKAGILHDLLLFLLIGAVPGFSHAIPPVFMALGLMSVALFATLALVYRLKAFLTTRSGKPKNHLPRRRYAKQG